MYTPWNLLLLNLVGLQCPQAKANSLIPLHVFIVNVLNVLVIVLASNGVRNASEGKTKPFPSGIWNVGPFSDGWWWGGYVGFFWV